MPSVALHTAPFQVRSESNSAAGDDLNTSSSSKTFNRLPTLLSTPSGLAIIEIQGTIHAPFPSPADAEESSEPVQTPIGRLEFPLYDHNSPGDMKWMKKVYLYVGQHQRLVGEVKKLAKPLAIIQKRGGEDEDEEDKMERKHNGEDVDKEALEIAEVVRWKVIFQGRPEPV